MRVMERDAVFVQHFLLLRITISGSDHGACSLSYFDFFSDFFARRFSRDFLVDFLLHFFSRPGLLMRVKQGDE